MPLAVPGRCNSATAIAQYRHDALHGAAGSVHNTDSARGRACSAMMACYQNAAFRPHRFPPSPVHPFGNCGLCLLPVVTANDDGPARNAPGGESHPNQKATRTVSRPRILGACHLAPGRVSCRCETPSSMIRRDAPCPGTDSRIP